MESDQQPLVFPHNIIKMGKDLYEWLTKRPVLSIPVGAVIVGLAFYALLVYVLGSCLVSFIPPFLMLAVFWNLRIKRGRMLLLAGVAACTVMMIVESLFFIGLYTESEPGVAVSDDPAMVLRDGVVSPQRGDYLTVFNYTLNIYTNGSTPLENVTVVIVGISSWENHTMMPGPRNDTVAQYYYTSTMSESINQFVFWAKVNGTWYLAADYQDGEEVGVLGPVHTSTWEVAKPMLYYSSIQAYLQFFLIYFLLVGMIWWTRRARRMREKQLEKWETKQREAAAQAPKDEAKVPSLAKAMGLEKEETFVCSECGADVPSEATVCPKCGEKFE